MDYSTMLLEGRVVTLRRFPASKFIMHLGWFQYDNENRYGWYFKSVTGNIVLPIVESDCRDMVIVDWNHIGHSLDIPPRLISGELPEEYQEMPAYITNDEKKLYDSAFITVETLTDRYALESYDIPNGKIVRVNEVDGEVKYYVWNKSILSWEDFVFPVAPSSDDTEPTEDATEPTEELSTDNPESIEQ